MNGSNYCSSPQMACLTIAQNADVATHRMSGMRQVDKAGSVQSGLADFRLGRDRHREMPRERLPDGGRQDAALSSLWSRINRRLSVR
jgi:hypothetical protein